MDEVQYAMLPRQARGVTLALCGLLISTALARGANVEGLQVQLETQLRARRPVEIAFFERVVGMVERDELPLSLVQSTMLWARPKRPHPFPYFRRVLILRAAKLGIKVE